MPELSVPVLPKSWRRSASNQIDISPLLLEAASGDAAAALAACHTPPNGLTEEEAADRLAKYGPNVVTEEARHTKLKLLLTACRNPLVVLLSVLATLSFLTGDFRAGIVLKRSCS